jgi:uncharacterized damage-inducible protein DinB
LLHRSEKNQLLRLGDNSGRVRNILNGVTSTLDLADALVAAWRTNGRVTAYLFENLPTELWPMAVPGMPRRSVRTIAGHIHNARCMWTKMLGQRHGVRVPKRVSLRTVTREELLPALQLSGQGIVDLLELGISRGGRIPASGVPWLNLPVDVGHVLAYLVAHEGHHRGQVVLLARQLGRRLPGEITSGLWLWSKRAKEAQARR